MTSRFALLTAMAGMIGAGCSGGDDGGSSTPPPPPSGLPAFANQQNQMQAAANTTQMTPTPVTQQPQQTNTEMTPPVMMMMPAGAGGMPGTGGTGGMMMGGVMIPTGMGNALTPVAGHIAGTSNGVGIQGDFFTFSDADNMPPRMPGMTTIMPKPSFAMAMGSTICASGTASMVVGSDYDTNWGGGIGLTLADPGGGAGGQPWNRGKVTGFSFNITGSTIPAGQLRFHVQFYDGSTINTTPYCKNIAAGANTVTLSTDVVSECYNNPPGGPVPATAPLSAIQWQVASNTTAPTPFNFCIENLTAIVSP